MSLLLDVLRKAEEEHTQTGAAHSSTRIELEPLPEATHRQAAQSSATAHEPTAPDLSPTTAATPRPPAVPKAPIPEAPAPTLPQQARSARRAWQPICAAALTTGLISAAWLWLTPSPASLAHATHAPARLPDLVPEPPASPAPAPAFAPEPEQETAVQPIRTQPIAVMARAQKPEPRPVIHEPAAEQEEPVHFLRSTADTAPAAQLITRAHDAYTTGKLPLAQTLYREALAADPANVDALDGLGAIALRDGHPAEAEAYFRRALLARPHDPVALAGLSRLHTSDPQQTETRLKNHLASQPDAPAPHLALAETLARQQRWAEAQQAWFQAHRLAPHEPDIAYNLAVSLDHLGQRRPAASYYRKALDLTSTQPARFSREHCETRLKTLQAQEPAP